MEAVANFDLTRRWRLSSSYTFGRISVHHKGPTSNPIQLQSVESNNGSNPRHQFQTHSYFKMPWNGEFDTGLYSVSSLPYQRIPSYVRLDVRFGWRIKERVDWSMGAQNLLDNRHPEFIGLDTFLVSGEIRRSVYGKLTWRF